MNHGTSIASNSRAELGAILEALRRNEKDDLDIGPDSLASLRAICSHAEKYEDQNWSGIQNADLLKAILIKLRMKLARTAFKWVKGHDDNDRTNRADELAKEGRENNLLVKIDDEDWIENHAALQDDARLQALEAKHIYEAILKSKSKKTNPIPIPNQETMDEAKDSGRNYRPTPTNEKIQKGFKTLGISPRLRDHMRCMATGRIKYWVNTPEYDSDRALLVLQQEKKFRKYGDGTTYVARMRKEWSSPGLGNSKIHLATYRRA